MNSLVEKAEFILATVVWIQNKPQKQKKIRMQIFSSVAGMLSVPECQMN